MGGRRNVVATHALPFGSCTHGKVSCQLGANPPAVPELSIASHGCAHAHEAFLQATRDVHVDAWDQPAFLPLPSWFTDKNRDWDLADPMAALQPHLDMVADACVAVPAQGSAVLQRTSQSKPGVRSKREEAKIRKMNRKSPNAEDEEWQRRSEKRADAVEMVKSSDHYLSALQWCKMEGAPRPEEPDPRDRNCTKRPWEEKMRKWGADLHKLAATCH